MSEERPEQTPTNRQALLAFRLGWVTAELLGHLRKGYRPRPRPPHGDDYAPRLSVGHGQPPSKGEQLWLAARRLVDLSDALELAPRPLQDLLQEIEDWLRDAQGQEVTPAALRETLNDWSLEAWSKLHTQDDTLARAFRAGMSVADTFWSLRRPPRASTEDTRASYERWSEPLRALRLEEERRRLKEIAGDLPAGISDVLRHHLRQWSIAYELYRDGEQIQRVAWPYRLSHPFGFLHRHSPVKAIPQEQREGERKVLELKRDEERAILDALERQTAIWQDLIFGLRTPESYLYARERPWVVWLARALFFVLLILPLAAAAVTLVSLASVWLGGVAVPSLLNAVEDHVLQSATAGWSDLLKLLSTLLTTVGTFVVGIRPLLNWLKQAYQRIRHEVAVYFVTRRTLIPWDRELGKTARLPDDHRS